MNHAREFFWKAMQRAGLVKRRKHHFKVAIESYLERLHSFPGALRQEVTSGGVGVLIVPWLQTSVPLYSLECARKFVACGEKVTLIWDDTNIFNSAANAWESGLLAGVVDRMRNEMTVVESPADAPAWENEPAFFDEFLTENAVQACRGERGVESWLAQHPELRAEVRAHIERVRELLRRRRFDWLYVPGGIWAVSGIYAAVAREQGLRTVTYDSGPGSLFVASDGVAAHFPDVASVAQAVIKDTKGEAELPAYIERATRQKLEQRMCGTDEYRLQPIAAATTQARPAWDILVPLNLRWDSAALCRRRLFQSVGDWLSQLLQWLERHPRATMALRQHPCEKLPDFRGSDDYGSLLAQHPQLKTRVAFLSAEEKVNTYDLIRGAKAVLPFTSRVGIEAAMLGKPVILATECYYGACGFTWNPSTAQEYFAVVEDALIGKLDVGTEARRRAWITYYLAECCLELKTRFTPAPVDYAHWVKASPTEIWSRPENARLLTALIDQKPLVAVCYQQLAEAEKAIIADR